MIEYLQIMHEILGLSPSTAKKGKKERQKEKRKDGRERKRKENKNLSSMAGFIDLL